MTASRAISGVGSTQRCNEGRFCCFGCPPQRAVCSCYLVARGLFGPNSCCGAEFVQIPAFCGSSFSLTFDFLVLPPLQEYAQTRPHNMSPGQKDPVQPQTAGSNYRLPAVEVRKEAFLAYFGVDACSTILFLDHIFPPYKVASFRTPRNSISGAK